MGGVNINRHLTFSEKGSGPFYLRKAELSKLSPEFIRDLEPIAHFLKETTPAWLQQHIATMDAVTANFFSMCE